MKPSVLLTCESLVVDAVDVVVVQLEDAEVGHARDGALRDAPDLVVGQVPETDIWLKTIQKTGIFEHFTQRINDFYEVLYSRINKIRSTLFRIEANGRSSEGQTGK